MQALGVLAGSGSSDDRTYGYLIMAIKPDLMLPLDDFRRDMSEMLARVKATPRQPGVDEIRLPGRARGPRARPAIQRKASRSTARSTTRWWRCRRARCRRWEWRDSGRLRGRLPGVHETGRRDAGSRLAGEHRAYCNSMPTSFTSFDHFARSERMNAANFSGVSGWAWKP